MHATARILLSLALSRQLAGTFETLAIQENRAASILSLMITRNYDPFSSEETCHAPLYKSDSNQDGKLSDEEYAQFVSVLSNGAISVQSYRDLTFELQVAFLYLDCLCGDDQNGNCCDGYIDITGASPYDKPTEEELTHLNLVCSKTQSALNDGDISSSGSNISEVPTISPVALSPATVPTDSPIIPQPIEPPTVSPVTNPSTISPSANPSLRPIQSPTYNPITLSPSSNPSPRPSLRPTPLPSLGPIETPTLSPIELPSDSRDSPSVGPSLRPSTPPSSLVPMTPTPNNSPSISEAPQQSISDAYTKAPTSVDNSLPLSTSEPTLHLSLSYRPSQEPSSVYPLNGIENSDEEGSNSGDATAEVSSAAVFVGILFPLFTIGFAGLFVFANEKKKKGTKSEVSLPLEEIGEDFDEELGLSRTTTEPNEQRSCLLESMCGAPKTSRLVDRALSEDEKMADEVELISESVVSDTVETNDKNVVNESTCGEIAIMYAVADVSSENDAVRGGFNDLDQVAKQICETSASNDDDLVVVAPGVVHPFSSSVEKNTTENMPKALNNLEPKENHRILSRISVSQSGEMVFDPFVSADECSELVEADRTVTRECTSEPCGISQTHIPDSACASDAAIVPSDAVGKLDEDEVKMGMSHINKPEEGSDDEENLRGSVSEHFVEALTFGLATRNSQEEQHSSVVVDNMPPLESSEAVSPESVGTVSPDDRVRGKHGVITQSIVWSALETSGKSKLSVSDSNVGHACAIASSHNASVASSEGIIKEMKVMAMTSIASARISQSPSQEQTVESISKRKESTIDSSEVVITEDELFLCKRQKIEVDVIEPDNKGTIGQERTTIDRNHSACELTAQQGSFESAVTSAAFALTLTTCANNNDEDNSHATDDVDFAEETEPSTFSMVTGINEKRQVTANVNDISKSIEAGNWTAVRATAALLASLTEDSSSDAEHLTPAFISDADGYPATDVAKLIKAREFKEFDGRENALVSALETLHDQRASQRVCTSVENSATDAARVLRAQEMQIISDDDSSTTTSSNTSVSGEVLSPKSFLEQAIEKGDWHAVGQAAAILGRTSDYDSVSSASSDSSTTSISRTLSWDKEDRIKHFDHLIAKGDWRGIVVAAGQYQAIDDELSNKP